MAWPAFTSMVPDLVSTRSRPRNTTVYSSNSGIWPGSLQPAGLSMRAMLTAAVAELTRLTYSTIRFERLPAAAMIVGFSIRSGMDILKQHRTTPDRRLNEASIGWSSRNAFHIPHRTAPEARILWKPRITSGEQAPVEDRAPGSRPSPLGRSGPRRRWPLRTRPRSPLLRDLVVRRIDGDVGVPEKERVRHRVIVERQPYRTHLHVGERRECHQSKRTG